MSRGVHRGSRCARGPEVRAALCLLVAFGLTSCASARRSHGLGTDAGPGQDATMPSDGAPPDAGLPDATPPDTGPADSGGFDAGRDGGRDAGAPDAGHDAGAPDAGSSGCPAGLAAWWRFESTSGPVVDACGHHDGVTEGTGFSRGVAGHDGMAIQFNGTDGRVVVPAASDLDFITAGTIELWVRVDGSGVGSTLSRGTGASDDNVLQNTSCWNMQTIFSRATGGTTNVTSACDALPHSIWVHVAVVNDGTSLRLYVNGALNTEASGGYLGPLATDLYMGRRQGGLFPLDGAMDEVKWWTVARTQSQICGDAGGTWTGTSCAL